MMNLVYAWGTHVITRNLFPYFHLSKKRRCQTHNSIEFICLLNIMRINVFSVNNFNIAIRKCKFPTNAIIR